MNDVWVLGFPSVTEFKARLKHVLCVEDLAHVGCLFYYFIAFMVDIEIIKVLQL